MKKVTVTITNELYGTEHTSSIPAELEDIHTVVGAFRGALLSAGFNPEQVDDAIPRDDRELLPLTEDV